MAFNLNSMTGALEETNASPPGVNFSGRSLKLDTEEDAKPIIDAIKSCADLTSLDLTGNTLGVAAAEAIARALSTRPRLKIAKWSDMFTGRLNTEIPPALRALGNGMIEAGTRLTVLELSDNAFGPIGVEGLAKLLQSSVCSQLQELRLNNNGLGITGGRLLSKALLGTGQSPPRLKVFIAGRNRLENDGAIALAQVFQQMGSLEEIAMPQNGIYHVGVSALCEAFSHNPNLRTINLNDNTVGPKGAEAFAKVLPRLRHLRTLNLGDCLLKSKGVLALSQAFKENDIKLEVLDLSHNEIGSAACADLVASVSRLADSLDRLERVVLAGNKLGGSSGKKWIRTKIGAAAALSDGEGSDDDDDDDESEEEEESDGSEATGSDNEIDESVENGATTINESVVEEVNSDVALFLKEPTAENFKRIGHSAAYLIHTHLECISDTCKGIEAYVEATMLVSGLSGRLPEAATAARDMYSRCVGRAAAQHAPLWMLTNAILVHVGLIKSESKSFKVRWDLAGCLSVLSDVITQPFIPEPLRETVRFFARSRLEKEPDSELAKYLKLF